MALTKKNADNLKEHEITINNNNNSLNGQIRCVFLRLFNNK